MACVVTWVTVRVGVVILPSMPWADARTVWQQAEALGAHTAWTYDHLTWRDLRDGPWFSALPLLTAAAGVTTSLRLGTLVTSPNFRHPVTLAKEAMTVDEVSGGRFTLGIGAGGTGWDAEAMGQEAWTPAERADRFAEFVGHLDHLLTHPITDRLEGQWYTAVHARSIPGCVQQPRLPFAIAGGGPRALAVAARHAQIWVTLGDPKHAAALDPAECLAVARRQAGQLDAACEAVGRPPGDLDRLYMQGATTEPWLESVEAFRELAGRYQEIGFTDLALHWPRREPPYVADEAVFAEILAGS
jgi:alkanesulfonate monooxygenase SsuD/methylene tetrahydromethanopterin reductase-like flavin-dependent oxidoreductase (luciferase family)